MRQRPRGSRPAGSLSGKPAAEAAARALKQRTLTTLYNTRPQWLTDAHTTLDSAVATACGWPADISEDDALRELPALNSTNLEKQDGQAPRFAIR